MMRRAVGPGGPIRLAIARAKQAAAGWAEFDGVVRTMPGNMCPLTAPFGIPAQLPVPSDYGYSDAVTDMIVTCADVPCGYDEEHACRYEVVRRALLTLVQP